MGLLLHDFVDARRQLSVAIANVSKVLDDICGERLEFRW